jgi:hypothetical protein
VLTVDFDRLGLRPGDRVLDMGCGAGRHAFEMYRRGADVIAFDMDADELAKVSDLFHAMKQAGEVPEGAEADVKQGDALQLPFADGEFDRVVAAEVLEHIPADVLQSGRGELRDQLLAGVDPHVSTFDLMVGVGQRPAVLLRQPARHGEGHRAAGAEHPHELGDRGPVVGDVLEDLRGDHAVELAVGERHREGVALLDVGLGVGRDLPRLAHRREDVEDAGELVAVLVERDHVGAAAVHLERVPSGAAAHVEHPVAGPEAEPVEVHGQHQASWAGVSSGTARPAALITSR